MLDKNRLKYPGGGGGGYSIRWPIQGARLSFSGFKYMKG